MTTIEPPRDLSTHTFFSGESAYVGEADYEGAVGKGSGSAWSGRFQLGVVRPVSGLRLLDGNGGQWQLRLGMDYERFEFNHTGAFPLPARLQRIAAVVALEYRIGRQVGVLIDARPGVHFENRIASNAWNCPVQFGIGIPLTDRFTLALAGRFDAMEEHPIVGGPGFIWKINDRLILTALPPEPRLTWVASKDLTLWLSGELAGGAFRTDGRASDPRISDAVVSYSDKRVSLGGTWTRGSWTLEASAGVSIEREWDYHRVDRSYATDGPAPFAKLAARAQW